MNAFSRVCAVIMGVLMVIMGIWMCATPVASLVGLTIFMTIALVVYGAYEIYLYFAKSALSGWVLASGILSVLLGAWMIFSGNAKEAMIIALPFIFAFWVMIGGINRTIASFTLKNLGSERWGWLLAIGILGIVCGFLLTLSPVVSALTLSFAIGIGFMWQGVAITCQSFAGGE